MTSLTSTSLSAAVEQKKSTSVHSNSIVPSNSEDISSDESDSDSSYPESNDSDDDTSTGSNLKSRDCSVPPLTSTRMKTQEKQLVTTTSVVREHVSA